MSYIRGREQASLREIKKWCLQYTWKDREHLNTPEIEKMNRMWKNILVKRPGTTRENGMVQVHFPMLSCNLCNPVVCSPPGSSIHGIFRPKYWSELPFPSPGDLPYPGMESFLFLFFFFFFSLWVSFLLLHWQADSLPLYHLDSLNCSG